jgi:integrase/recombinase XerD
MKWLKHLPLSQWPEANRAALAAAYAPGDIFDDACGPGAHLTLGTRRMIETAYRRWLGYLYEVHPLDLLHSPADRITPDRVRAFINRLRDEVGPTTIAVVTDNLLHAARLLAPHRNWEWLRLLKRRLRAQVRPKDRFDHLVPGWQTLELGLRLMDEASTQLHTESGIADVKYRDGLLLAVLSCWPIRRRSIARLSVSDHLEPTECGINILLHAADTKSKRPDAYSVPCQLLPYLRRYLREVRPRLQRHHADDALWQGSRGRLSAGRIYDIVRREIKREFGKSMGLHDLRRAGATFLAMAEPTEVGLIPGLLQHASPAVSETIWPGRSRRADALGCTWRGREADCGLASLTKRFEPMRAAIYADLVQTCRARPHVPGPWQRQGHCLWLYKEPKRRLEAAVGGDDWTLHDLQRS